MGNMNQKRLTSEFLDEFKGYTFSKIIEETIFLVGSISKARDLFIKIESILQIQYGKIVSICSVDGLLNKHGFSKDEWDKLQKIALRKLKNQDAVLVLDVDNYIGSETREEIEYFREKQQKPIYYLSKLKKEN